MTSITNKTAHSAISASLKPPDMSPNKSHSNMDESNLQAETIEVVPELPFHDSEDDFSEYSDEHEAVPDYEHRFGLNDDDDDEPFDEYAYQVISNHSEPQTVWFDNSQLRSLPLDNSTGDSDVILINDEDSDDDFNENSNGGLTHEPPDISVYSCGICSSRLSSSYNLKRHMMIHTGEKPFECDICKRRFREQSDLRKHKKVHSNDSSSKCSICKHNPTSSRNSSRCIRCSKQDTEQMYENPISDALVPRIDGNNKKSFVCKYCDRSFGSSSNLKRHIMIHTGEKPFTCPTCRRPFREMSTLKKHLITHRKQNGFNVSDAIKPTNSMQSSKPTQFPQSLHKYPFCKTICRGTESLMNHITSVHRPNKPKSNPIKSHANSQNLHHHLFQSSKPLSS